MPKHPITEELLASKIHVYRAQKVMLDADLAELYEVSTKRLNQQVGRNLERFPEDFMFQLSDDEFADLKTRTAGKRWGGRRYAPYAFTEHGVLMLSSVLNSDTAVAVNIEITRVFTRMRRVLMGSQELLLKIGRLEREVGDHGADIALIFDYLRKLLAEPAPEVAPERRRIGFRTGGIDGDRS